LSTLSDSFKQSIKEMINGQRYNVVEPAVGEVLSWEEFKYQSGYCDTCWYEETRVKVRYLDVNGQPGEYEYSGGFQELLEALLAD
jgi:hypothetical protein